MKCMSCGKKAGVMGTNSLLCSRAHAYTCQSYTQVCMVMLKHMYTCAVNANREGNVLFLLVDQVGGPIYFSPYNKKNERSSLSLPFSSKFF